MNRQQPGSNNSAPTVIKVGIIDSGISASPAGSVARTRDFSSDNIDHNCPDQLGHGSAVAEVISAAASNIELYIARVFSSKLTCSAGEVSRAIDWLGEQGVDLINMSFGLRDDRPQLQAACLHASARRILLVAAAPASGGPVYPAQYPTVIRATGDARCRPRELSHLHSRQADYGACPRYEGLAPAGASIGCAGVSGLIARLLGRDSHTDIHAQLQRLAHYHGVEQRHPQIANTPEAGQHER